MTVQPLRLLGDPVLRTACDPVTRFDDATGTGELSRALQHETDHLRGVLFIDQLTGQRRKDALAQILRVPG